MALRLRTPGWDPLSPRARRQLRRLPCCALICGSLCPVRRPVPGVSSVLLAPFSRHFSAGRAGRSGLPPSAAVSFDVGTSARGSAAGRARGEQAHVLSIATEYRQEAVILQRCARRLGYHFQFVGLRDKWLGFGTKLVQYRRALSRGLQGGHIASDDPVLLIDGWDCAIIGPAEEFRRKMASAPYVETTVPWYAGERICGPDFFKASRIDAVFPDLETPWKYPNAGCMCGRAEPVLRLLEDLLAGPEDQVFPEDGNDQGRLHEYLLEVGEGGGPLPFQVDSRCGIFQCLYEAEPQWDLDEADTKMPRLRNRLTGERPIVLHGNGHTGRWFMSMLYRDMRFLERIGLTPEDLAHLPHDGPVPPGTVPDEATERNWAATFELYRIIETQMAYARMGIEYDPWKMAAAGGDAEV
mmetsp:Transcript_21167/g.46679  ORF Transcript_21167/g.46679 Transcript_21167/m.46679 type:complete len:411 (-) Transcript_21167:86-1318(-)